MIDNLTNAEKNALKTISKQLEVDPEILWRLIQFESRWNPAAANPKSSAKGLIQITDSTARSLGYRDSAAAIAANPDRISQLQKIVYPYLKKYKPFPTEQSLYMAVFYPVARFWPETKPFPIAVTNVNPGIRTPLDYIRKVYLSLSLHHTPRFVIFLTAGFIAYLILTKKI